MFAAFIACKAVEMVAAGCAQLSRLAVNAKAAEDAAEAAKIGDLKDLKVRLAATDEEVAELVRNKTFRAAFLRAKVLSEQSGG